MIHTITVTPESSPEALKKEFRKKLMTGGCVIRIKSDLSGSDAMEIFNRFLPYYAPNNAASEVLRQLACSTVVAADLRLRLAELGDGSIAEALKKGQGSAHGA